MRYVLTTFFMRTISVSCAIALQKLLDICHEYGVEHDVIYNPLTYVCMVFKPDRFSLKCPLVHLGNNVLEYHEKVKYLGVLLNDNLNDNDDIMKQMHPNTLIKWKLIFQTTITMKLR